MERIGLFVRSTKTDGDVWLRYRIREGRNVDIYYRSGVKAQLKDLEKFTQDGKVKPRVSVYNEELAICIDNTIAALHDAYSNLLEKNLSITSDNLQMEADKLLNGEASIARFKNPTLLERFAKFREDRYRDNIFAENRYKHYRTLHGKLSRFLKIKRKYTIKPSEFTTDLLMEFRAFILDEYKYVSSHPHIYADMAKRDTPDTEAWSKHHRYRDEDVAGLLHRTGGQ